MAATNVSSFTSLAQTFSTTRSLPSSKASSCVSHPLASGFVGASLPITSPKKRVVKSSWKVSATAAVETAPVEEEIKDFILPSWAMFELGRAPVYWKTMNGLPPTAGEKIKVFYNPAANKLVPNEEYGVAFNGGFNQPIMCGGEPRAMRRTDRGTADGPIFTIQIVIPKHALNVIFSFTNGVDWDGPYRLQFQVPKAWRNRPIEFFNEVGRACVYVCVCRGKLCA
ncbi:hypothetical protein HS088_TW12G00286 [Tripterygium wilfordii]|uniref:PIFI-like Ig-like domain-containing protein n=1 Tax=Tripterygium wilfordii TaxID=458696 RepID=A0A7J7CYA7_TRIWF|nr:hypothetical protein HS088_TW12G00286 [Tripterygium wilfordii]